MSEGPRYDVCVVGGAGHVGAPLAIVLAQKGLRTLVHDTSQAAMDTLAAGKMPFSEVGAEPLLAEALASGRLSFSADPACVAFADVLVVTIGTPIDEFHNPRLDVVTRCLDALLPHLHDGQSIVLRSTVFPGVTEFVLLRAENDGLRGRWPSALSASCRARRSKSFRRSRRS